MYNEEKRAPKFLNELINFSKKNLKNYELIFVDDGSKDKTLDMCKAFKTKNIKIKIISYKKNQGKGFAVKTGVFNAKGEKIIFIDADGSIPPEEISKMLRKLSKYDVVVGNRSSKKSVIKQSNIRKVTGTSFNILVNILFKININDNLCGFKGFKKEVACNLFKELIDKRWLFDVELFYKIKKKKYSLYRLPIVWEHKTGSKIKFFDPIIMMLKLINLRIKLLKKPSKI